MVHVFIGYATAHGQTRAVAESIAQTLRMAGNRVELQDLNENIPHHLGRPDTIVLGSYVHAGKHAPAVHEFVKRHRATLDAVPTGFFSVSMSAATATPEKQAEAAHHLDSLVQATGWRPGHVALVAGAVKYTQYGRFLRWLMKQFSWKAGNPTDTSRDHEFTNWSAVTAFAWDMANAASTRDPIAQCVA